MHGMTQTDMELMVLVGNNAGKDDATMVKARIAQLRAALDVVERFHDTLGKLEDVGGDPEADGVIHAATTLAAQSQTNVRELTPAHETEGAGWITRFGIEVLARQVAHDFHFLVGCYTDPMPDDENPAEEEEAAEAPLSLPGPRVDPATKARARKVHSLWKATWPTSENGAAKQRLEDMAAQKEMPFDTFLAACGLTP